MTQVTSSRQETKTRKIVISLSIALLITLSCILLGTTFISKTLIHHALQMPKYFSWYFCALLLLISTYLIRALRLNLIAKEELGLAKSLRIISLTALISHLLPAKLGDITIPYLLNKHAGIKILPGIKKLLYMRFLDLIVILSLLLVAILLNHAIRGVVDTYLPEAWFYLPLLGLLAWLATLWFLKTYQPNFSWYEFIKLLSISFLTWLTMIFAFYFISLSLHQHNNFSQVFISSVCILLIFNLPINGLANFGPMELVWVTLMKKIFLSESHYALATITTIHITLILVALVFFMVIYALRIGKANTSLTKESFLPHYLRRKYSG